MPSENDIAVVLLLARVNPSPECIARANAFLQGGADWEGIRQISLVHGVAPLVYKNIPLLEDVPPGVAERFGRLYAFSMGNAVRASRDLGEITDALDGRGVESVAIKGILVADELLGNVSLYPSSDIDILVRRSDALRVCEIMRERGYRPEPPLPPDCRDDWHFFREGSRTVDFHFRLGSRRYFDIPGSFWWDDLRERCFEGRNYRTLSVENNLLFLSLHLFDHGHAPLKFLVVIAELLRVRGSDIKWEELVGSARRYNALNPLLLSLYLASKMLDAPLPAIVSRLIERRSRKERRIFRRIEELVFAERARLSTVMLLLTFLQYDAFHVAGRMLRWIFPPLGEISHRYELPLHSKRAYVYYILNPVLLLMKRRQL